MKPDNDPLFCHSTLVSRPDSKLVEYKRSAFDTTGLGEIKKESQTGVMCDLYHCEKDESSLTSEINDKDGFWNTPELVGTLVAADFTNRNENGARESVTPCPILSSKMELIGERNLYADRDGKENEVRDSVAPCTTSSGKMELFEKDRELYTDKNAMQCELTELTVCHDENSYYHDVKDICIDEGVPFKDNSLIEGENDMDLCTIIIPLDENENGAFGKERQDIELLSPNGLISSSENDPNEVGAPESGTKEKVDIELLMEDALKSLLENHFIDDIDRDGGSLSPLQTSDANYNSTYELADDVSREKFVTSSNATLLQKLSKQDSPESLLKSSNCDGNEVEQQSGQIRCSEAFCDTPAVVSAAEEPNKIIRKLLYNSKVESATIIFDFNSSKSASSGRDERPEDANCEQSVRIDSEPRHEDVISDSFAVGNEAHPCQGESSFSIAGPMSSLITCSGSMACSSNVSLRSDGSTASTRSFAFPILQSEWNSSPVRMAKAERRHYRKHKGWRQGLLFCCRF